MKKNLISVIILALLIVNIALTAIMMFSVVGASKKTAALVDNIATATNLELSSGTAGPTATVSMADTETYSFAETMTIPLKKTEGDDITTVSFRLPCRLIRRRKGIRSMAPPRSWARWKD